MAQAISTQITTLADRQHYDVNSTRTSGLISNILSTAGQQRFPGATIRCDIFKTADPFKDWMR